MIIILPIYALPNFLGSASALFLVGFWACFAMRHNLIILLMAIEMILLSCILLFVYFSTYSGDLVGIIFAMYILTVAASETSIGLAIFVALLPCAYEFIGDIFKYDQNVI